MRAEYSHHFPMFVQRCLENEDYFAIALYYFMFQRKNKLRVLSLFY